MAERHPRCGAEARLAGFLPAQGPPRLLDAARGLAGGFLGILLAGLVGRLALGTTGDLPWLVAPMGASAVLVYAVPGSPLAQPWSVVAGNVTSALVGLAAGWAIDPLPLAAAVGVGASAAGRAGVSAEDVAAAMARLDQGLDIAPGDVLALMRDAEEHVLDRRLGGLRCGDVMSTDVVTVGPADSLYRVRILINQTRVKALPVLDAERRVVGIVSIVDLFNRDAGDVATVESVMTTDVAMVHEDTPVAALVELMAERGYRHLPVLDADDRLVGLVSRAELISVLHRLLVRGTA